MSSRLCKPAVLSLLALLLVPALASAHAGHAQEPLRMSPSLVDAANADLHALADAQLRAVAPAAVNGQCVRTIDIAGQGPSCRLRGGLWGVRHADGTTESTHGPDFPADVYDRPDVDPAEMVELAAAENLTDNPDDSQYVACAANPRVPHAVAVYAIPQDLAETPTHTAQVVQDIRASLRQASRFVQLEATGDGSSTPVRIRLQCTAAGTIDVQVKTIATSKDDTGIDFTDLEDAIRASGATGGHDDTARVLAYYPVEVDSGASGQGSLYSDSDPTPDNYNNDASQTAIQYASGYDDVDWSVFLHETMHNMGAVQDYAPHATRYNGNGAGGHCSTAVDVMCYDDDDDAATFPMTPTCATVRLDCSGDTYFNAGTPAAGSWLANHWNSGGVNNAYLDFGSRTRDITAPDAPTNVAVAVNGPGAITTTWSAAVDDSPLPLSYQVSIVDASTGGVVTRDVTTTSLVLTGIVAPQVRVSVRATDAAGNVSASSAVAAATLPDRNPPLPAAFLRVAKVSGRAVTFGWTDTNTGRAAHVYIPQAQNAAGRFVDIRGAKGAQVTVNLAPGTRQVFRVLSRVDGIPDVASPLLTVGMPVAPSRCTWKANDRIAPAKLGSARVSARKGRTVTVTWRKPSDANGVCAVRFLRKVGRKWKPIGPAVAATRTSTKLAGVSASTSLVMEAFDGSGNLTKRVAVARK